MKKLDLDGRNNCAAQQFGEMAGSVLNSSLVLRLNFGAKLDICALKSTSSPRSKTVGRM